MPGLDAVAGAMVQLLEVKGARVLAVGTTNARGVYTLPAPPGFEPGPGYMVRATSGDHRLEAFVAALRTNIDPATDALAKLLLQHANVPRLRSADVQLLMPLVQHLAWDVDLPAAHTGSALAAMLRTAAADDEELFSIIASVGAPGEITGRVTDAEQKPVERVTMLARDTATGVGRAMTHTDAEGRYRLRVRPGDYQVVAMNETARNTAASAFGAKSAAGTVRDFQLPPGGRVSGLVTSQNRAGLANVRVKLVQPGGPALEVRTQDDGSYRFNVAPGRYVLLAENTTSQPFASHLPGLRIDVQSGGELIVDLLLVEGQRVSGATTPGSTVRIVDARSKAPVHTLRANRAGQYRLWLKPGSYAVQ